MMSKRNYFIEYLRLLFCFVIVFWHGRTLSGVDIPSYFCKAGNYATDFFAVLSGYLLLNSIEIMIRNEREKSADRDVINYGACSIYMIDNGLSKCI